jgi:hypothetical protein
MPQALRQALLIRWAIPISEANMRPTPGCGRLGDTDMMKTILGRHGNDQGHWVGDGFPVRSLFS